ncbi:hypothetical protein DY000_02047526 [Brassica cretica]|uniref:Uncharacterized protein n=1 Tax=Brassica cretica TaxID=69181 RepID=A0ABQ7ET49_BRACR|nr:hypothetical protein DY000_02047526 [Brassica cretica]
MAATKMFFRSGRLLGSFHGSLLKYNVPDDFQEVFQTISRKSSESLLTESSPMSFLFITNLSVLVFNRMVLIFHLDISGFDMQVFSDLEDFSDDLHVSRIKYNALDDFQKSSRRLPGSLLTKFSFISSGVQACLCR